ncbi:MAG: DUF4129 domain-containing protein [Clostridia bacterium]|nr:DUF4129 domain-containing protein [Deltaproteobacteria bacterium]
MSKTKSPAPFVANADDEWTPKVAIAIPDDVVGFSRAAFARGEAALALSVLYRGAIAMLAREADIDFPEGATEQECVMIVRGGAMDNALRDAFEKVARTWQRCAYAHRLPDPDSFGALCDHYATSIAPFKRTMTVEAA